MRIKPALLLCAVCALPTGCNLVISATHNLANELVMCTDDTISTTHDWRTADSAWEQFRKSYPDSDYSRDFADGFKSGVLDYLEAANPAPPPLPPRCYWRSRYRTPEGHQAVTDWYTGHQEGVAYAQRVGYRRSTIVGTGSPDAMVPPPYHAWPPADGLSTNYSQPTFVVPPPGPPQPIRGPALIPEDDPPGAYAK
jgi:hypothetical protein